MKRYAKWAALAAVGLLAGCSFAGDSLRTVVEEQVAAGTMTREAGDAVLAATQGTIGYYAEHGVDIVLGAVAAYTGIDLRDRRRAKRAAAAAKPADQA